MRVRCSVSERPESQKDARPVRPPQLFAVEASMSSFGRGLPSLARCDHDLAAYAIDCESARLHLRAAQRSARIARHQLPTLNRRCSRAARGHRRAVRGSCPLRLTGRSRPTHNGKASRGPFGNCGALSCLSGIQVSHYVQNWRGHIARENHRKHECLRLKLAAPWCRISRSGRSNLTLSKLWCRNSSPRRARNQVACATPSLLAATSPTVARDTSLLNSPCF